jgi:hypothetical protein
MWARRNTPLEREFEMTQGMTHHDGTGTLTASALRNNATGDPPPCIVGNHTPARYAIRRCNKYTGF